MSCTAFDAASSKRNSVRMQKHIHKELGGEFRIGTRMRSTFYPPPLSPLEPNIIRRGPEGKVARQPMVFHSSEMDTGQ